MWLISETDESKRKALADYFSPTIVAEEKQDAGSTSFFGGASIVSIEEFQNQNGQEGKKTVTKPLDRLGGPQGTSRLADDKKSFERTRQQLQRKVAADGSLKRFARNLRFTETREGMRIDLIDDANFSMFTYVLI